MARRVETIFEVNEARYEKEQNMSKAPEIIQALKAIAPHPEGVPDEHGTKPTCPTCGKPIGEFKDGLSMREYRISGMCQVCQDSVFG